MSSDSPTHPSLGEFRNTHDRIAPHVNRTPIQQWRSPALSSRLAGGTEVSLKLEVLQPTGTFKVRGAINNVLAMNEAERGRGITTISAGNHAVAAAYAANRLGCSAKVVMMNTANPARIEAARIYGAEVFLADTIEAGFRMVEEMKESEGRTYIPSFPNEGVVCGTGTIALELLAQMGAQREKPDAIVVPVGGGGLISGIATCAKLLDPHCKVYGVEATGAGVISKSLAAGQPQKLESVDTVADSIAPPVTNDYALSLVSAFVDEIVSVTDEQMAQAAALLFSGVKLAVEPAGAASTAALLGPLKEILRDKKVTLIICGSNIDAEGYCRFLEAGSRLLSASA